jgi:hypothetical protein
MQEYLHAQRTAEDERPIIVVDKCAVCAGELSTKDRDGYAAKSTQMIAPTILVDAHGGNI